MKKQKTQMKLLVVVLLVCLLGYYAAVKLADQKEAEEERKENGEYTALSFEASDLRRITVTGENGTIDLNYDGEAWSFVNDINAEEAALAASAETEATAETEAPETEATAETEDSVTAETKAPETEKEETDTENASEDSEEEATMYYEVNATTANELLQDLSDLTCTNEIIDVTDLVQYGLDEPVMIITAEMADGTVHTVEVGDENTMISCRYIRVDGVDTVYTWNNSTYRLFNKCDTDIDQQTTEDTSESSTTESNE